MNLTEQSISSLKIGNIFNIATFFTFLRVVLTIVAIWGIKSQKVLLSVVAVALAGITDFLDGYLARIFKRESNFGKIFDPIADKFMLIILYCFTPLLALLVTILEICGIIQSAKLRNCLKAHYISPISKQITVGQMTLLGVLMLTQFFSNLGWLITLIGIIFVFLSYIRFIVYSKDLRDYRNSQKRHGGIW